MGVFLLSVVLVLVSCFRALNTYNEDFGPKHVKFVVEWDPKIKDR